MKGFKGINPIEELRGRDGFIHTNVASIGKKYNYYGNDPRILDLLGKKCDEELKLIDPYIILFRIGFGTKSNIEKDYVDILEETSLGKFNRIREVKNCPILFKLEFEKIRGSLFTTGLIPLCFKYEPIVKELKVIN